MKTTFYITALAAVFAAVSLTGPALAADAYKDLSIEQRVMVDQLPVMPANASSSEHPAEHNNEAGSGPTESTGRVRS